MSEVAVRVALHRALKSPGRSLAEADGRVKTSELIAALAADPVPEPIRLGRRVVAALAIGFLRQLGDLFSGGSGQGRTSPRRAIRCAFWLKFVDSFAFALPTLLLTLRLARPGREAEGAGALADRALHFAWRRGGRGIRLVVPQSEWMSRLMGANAMHCMITIPMLAAPVLAALIVALRAGVRRFIRPSLGRWPARLRQASRRWSTRRRARTICRCSWRPGIHSPPSSAWVSARWPAGDFWPGETDGRGCYEGALLLDQRVEDRLQLIHVELSAIDLAVDDESRRAGSSLISSLARLPTATMVSAFD